MKAIELANTQVKKVQLDKARHSGGETRGELSRPGGPYLMLTPAQRYEIGKRTSKHSTKNAMRYSMPESITSSNHWKKLACRDLQTYINSYPEQQLASTKSHDSDSDEDGKLKAKPEPVKEMPRKKQGQPFLLPD